MGFTDIFKGGFHKRHHRNEVYRYHDLPRLAQSELDKDALRQNRKLGQFYLQTQYSDPKD